MTTSRPPSPGAEGGTSAELDTVSGSRRPWSSPSESRRPCLAPLSSSTTSPRTCPRAEVGTPEWPSPGAFNQCQWAQMLSWPGFYTTNSSFLAKEGNAEDQMALGSLAALTPVELVFMGKKKKKNHPWMVTPGRPACWRKHGGTQGWACVRTGAPGSIVPIYPWPTWGPLFP